jgi:hypothetical protein
MLAYQESLLLLISLQPPHVQHDPVGESRASIVIRRFVGTTRVKTLAVPVGRVALAPVATRSAAPALTCGTIRERGIGRGQKPDDADDHRCIMRGGNYRFNNLVVDRHRAGP